MSIKRTLRWWIPLLWLCPVAAQLSAQREQDIRQQSIVRVEHRFTQDWSMAFMGAAILTNDLQRAEFFYGDVGIGYKLSPNWGVNANYRLLLRRRLNGAYDQRHLLYCDLDYSKSLAYPWSVTGMLRLQATFFNHLFAESNRAPNFYARTRLGLRYKVNYYWQPFAETELFTPLTAQQQWQPDQWRYSLGIAYTFHRYARVEIYEQIQQSLFDRPGSLFFLTAINWFFRF